MTAPESVPAERLADLLQTARAAARAAADLLAGARPADVRSKSSSRDLVTEWDLRAEETIRRVLEERERGIPILGEEGGLGAGGAAAGGAGGAAGLRWVVDPIDGTVNFAHGLPIWSVSIGLEADGVPLVGVVVAPVLGWWFEAVRGGGARDGSGAPLRVSQTARFDEAMLATGFPYDVPTRADNNLAEWDHFMRRAGTCRRLGCASLDLCLVGCGWFDGYWERMLRAWDLVAGAVIVREAGGTVTDTRGGTFDPHRGEVVATNGAIHEELIAELGRVRRPAS
ncbi:MAG TPA: inositol monophosphatase family protein [Kofleriaceae bacterium]|nr:inositol monophosphatase family protein [Kofleriaceae bacterium]